ncbi:MAG: insulinase family protein [candidate division Zixibacteria bacterium]|nr:insulinase family protein [candidate division Zixibacteria bacterium]NIR63329.1 insulinase family protein [candidate division Zixibacteria bacterium]NIS17324.1 insulinase family protein [candidate division Zixibacteria bacterium]NIS45314.1 insulinase family protein [candidate division Zixibacteria bacterium]NIT53684.1 insulinase family protein [candidate division Zixibacteria bacterium]
MLKKSVLIAVTALLFLFSFLIAQDNPLGWKITKSQLDNGMKIVVLEDHSTPSVAYQIWYHVGSKNERPGITGISHMIEHMMFKGTDTIGPEEHARIVQARGGTSNAFTHFDMTAYHEVMGAKDLEVAAQLEADRMANLAIDSAELASEKEVVAEERRTRIDNSPFGPLLEQLLNLSYTAHPYHWHVIGYMSDIQNYTHHKLRDYWNTYYKPNNATAVIVGDVDPDEAIEIVEKYYSDIPPGPANLYRPVTEEPEQMGERRAEVNKVAQLPGVFLGYKVVEAGHPDVYPLRVMGKILFQGESSRAYKRLVDEEQLCLYAGGDMFEFEDPGLFYLIAVMKGPDKSTEDAEAILYDEIDKLKTEPVPEEVLQKALNQIEAEKWYQLESNENKAYAIGWFETIRGDYSLMFDEFDNYLAVTADDIMRVANTYFDENNRTVVTLVPKTSGAAPNIGL